MATPVTIIIPTYNRAHLLGRAIKSVLPQTTAGDEILVIDDGSDDDTPAVAARYGEHIRFIRAGHEGAGPARNLGIREARNPLVAFLDSDDEWMPEKLELQRRLMDAQPDIDYCFSDFRAVDSDGESHPRYLKRWHCDARPWDDILGPGVAYSGLAPLPPTAPSFAVHIGDIYAEQMARPYIATFTLIYRHNADTQNVRFPTDLTTYEDWEFFGRLTRHRTGAYLDCETAIQHGDAEQRLTAANRLTECSAQMSLVQRIWGADEEFLAKPSNAARLEALMQDLETEHRLLVAKDLLRTGRIREARAAFRSIEGYPTLYRLLLLAPGFALRAAVRMRGS